MTEIFCFTKILQLPKHEETTKLMKLHKLENTFALSVSALWLVNSSIINHNHGQMLYNDAALNYRSNFNPTLSKDKKTLKMT
jgi:hypothetical protein